jgi:DNA ligase-1
MCMQARLDAAAAAASEAYHVCPSWDVLVPALMEQGAEALKDR